MKKKVKTDRRKKRGQRLTDLPQESGKERAERLFESFKRQQQIIKQKD